MVDQGIVVQFLARERDLYYVALGTTQLLSKDTGGCYPGVKAVG
jgi:hypothetical protein